MFPPQRRITHSQPAPLTLQQGSIYTQLQIRSNESSLAGLWPSAPAQPAHIAPGGLVSIPCLKPAVAVSGHIPARAHRPVHSQVVPWDVQPVGARSIHTNHQSYCIQSLAQVLWYFHICRFQWQSRVLCVFLAFRMLLKPADEGAAGRAGEMLDAKCSQQPAMPQDVRSRRAFLCCGSTIITPRLYQIGADRIVLQPRSHSVFISGLFMAISSLCWNLSSSKTQLKSSWRRFFFFCSTSSLLIFSK